MILPIDKIRLTLSKVAEAVRDRAEESIDAALEKIEAATAMSAIAEIGPDNVAREMFSELVREGLIEVTNVSDGSKLDLGDQAPGTNAKGGDA